MCATMNPRYQHRKHICMSLKHEVSEMPIIAYHDLEMATERMEIPCFARCCARLKHG